MAKTARRGPPGRAKITPGAVPVKEGRMERYNLVVVGAGSGGLVVAAGGASLGARVALVERRPVDYPGPSGSVRALGGDCLHEGCVPSKALLREARAANEAREAGRFG
ncbi:MAG TPA: FAD-dependent oxidoreductase, partial [Thermoanaerobaculia bacterium]|nr:FAD-dependent oxidoreductase [Thermoanaerobaculia bacterium]